MRIAGPATPVGSSKHGFSRALESRLLDTVGRPAGSAGGDRMGRANPRGLRMGARQAEWIARSGNPACGVRGAGSDQKRPKAWRESDFGDWAAVLVGANHELPVGDQQSSLQTRGQHHGRRKDLWI